MLAKCISLPGHFFVDYSELLGIIEGYIIGFMSIGRLIIESDSLIDVRRLSSHEEDLFELGCLIFNFLNNIDVFLVWPTRLLHCLVHS